MKKLAGLVIILAALVLGGFYGMGVLTEKTIRKNIDVIDQSNGLYAEIEQYNRGFFSSKAQVKWQLHVPERVVKDANGQEQTVPAQDYNVVMPLVVHHGPVIFANNKVRFGLGYAESVFPLPKEYETKFDGTFTKESTKPQLNLSIFINYLNQSTVDFQVPAFKLFAKEGGGRFDWLGMNATTTMSAEMKKIGGSVAVDGMHFAKDDTQVDLGKVSTDYDLHKTASGLYLGDANFNLPSFTVMVKGQQVFAIAELAIKSDSDIEEHLFNTHFDVTLKSILSNGKNYGPGDLEVVLRNLDADVLAKINQQATAMQNGTEAERQQAVIALIPELPKLFSRGAEFEISKLSLTIPQGQVEGNLFVGLPKEDNPNPFALMQKTHGNAKLKVPAAAVKDIMKQAVLQQIAKQPELHQALSQQLQGTQAAPAAVTTAPTGQAAQQPLMPLEQVASMQADKQLNTLQQNGLFTVQGTDYLVEVTLEQGKFTVNGKPFDPAMLKF